jgi:hypothetical protein
MPHITQEQAKQFKYPKDKWIMHTVLINKFGTGPDGIKKKITKKEMIKWLKEHDLNYNIHRATTNFHRYLQTFAIKDASYKTEKLSPYLEVVYQKY